ncbi:hypothetical protein BJV78DRAFT_1158103 [Lactifluus subvellereus]|nr:hypothetical protein BJV78DRAFT_1158103 [Lactifluus subvellereus]
MNWYNTVESQVSFTRSIGAECEYGYTTTTCQRPQCTDYIQQLKAKTGHSTTHHNVPGHLPTLSTDQEVLDQAPCFDDKGISETGGDVKHASGAEGEEAMALVARRDLTVAIAEVPLVVSLILDLDLSTRTEVTQCKVTLLIAPREPSVASNEAIITSQVNQTISDPGPIPAIQVLTSTSTAFTVAGLSAQLGCTVLYVDMDHSPGMSPPGIPMSYPENRITNVSGRIRFAGFAAATQSNGTGTTVSIPADRVQSEFAPNALNPKLVRANEKDGYEMA